MWVRGQGCLNIRTLSTLGTQVAYQGRTPLCWQGCVGPSISPPWPRSPSVQCNNNNNNNLWRELRKKSSKHI